MGPAMAPSTSLLLLEPCWSRCHLGWAGVSTLRDVASQHQCLRRSILTTGSCGSSAEMEKCRSTSATVTCRSTPRQGCAAAPLCHGAARVPTAACLKGSAPSTAPRHCRPHPHEGPPWGHSSRYFFCFSPVPRARSPCPVVLPQGIVRLQ